MNEEAGKTLNLKSFSATMAPVQYEVDEKALLYWSENCLEVAMREPRIYRFRFTYRGSTCRNGGQEFFVYFHVLLKDTGKYLLIKDGWIDTEKEELTRTDCMCSFGPSAKTMPERMSIETAFLGKPLSSALQQKLPLNYAGCICDEPKRNQKWFIVLSSIHYAITKGIPLKVIPS